MSNKPYRVLVITGILNYVYIIYILCIHNNEIKWELKVIPVYR